MELNKKIYKYLSATLAAAIVTTSVVGGSVYAESSSSIRQRLEEQERQNDELQDSLDSVQNAIDANKSKVESLNEIINNYNGVIKESKDQSQVVGDQLEKVVESKNSVAEEIAKLNQEIKGKIEKINKLEKDVVDIKEKIKKTENEIKRLKAEVEKNTKLLEERLVVMYKKGSVKDIEVLLASEDINDFLSRQTMMSTITNHDKKLIAKLKSDKEELDIQKAKLDGEKTALEIATENTKKEKEKLEKDKEAQDQLYEKLRVEEGLRLEEIEYLKAVTQEYEGYLSSTLENKKELATEIGKRESEIEDLESSLETNLSRIQSTRSELRSAEEAEKRARDKQEKLQRKRRELERLKEAQEAQERAEEEERQKLEETVDSTQGPSIPSTGSGFGWPAAANYITSYYGWRYLFGGYDFHTGLDIAGPLGTSIYASKSGVVTFSGWNVYGYGNLIIISHPDGSETRYAHLTQSYVSAGQSVSKGQNIAAMGTTGRSTGSHLHFEIRFGGETVDPLPYLR